MSLTQMSGRTKAEGRRGCNSMHNLHLKRLFNYGGSIKAHVDEVTGSNCNGSSSMLPMEQTGLKKDARAAGCLMQTERVRKYHKKPNETLPTISVGNLETRDTTVDGSMSSALSSSSGCSSVDSPYFSSSSPIHSDRRKTPRPYTTCDKSVPCVSNLPIDDDCLEVNEYLYLQSKCESSSKSNHSNTSAEITNLPSFSVNHSGNKPSVTKDSFPNYLKDMSEFSAFTLDRKWHSRQYRDAIVAPSKEVSPERSSYPQQRVIVSKDLKNWLDRSSHSPTIRSMTHKAIRSSQLQCIEQHCECSCCMTTGNSLAIESGDHNISSPANVRCPKQRLHGVLEPPNGVVRTRDQELSVRSSMWVGPIQAPEQTGFKWRRATMGKRPLESSGTYDISLGHNSTDRNLKLGSSRSICKPSSVYGRQVPSRSATVVPTRVQRPHAAKSVPVPPPVVPFFKEMALSRKTEGRVHVQEQRESAEQQLQLQLTGNLKAGHQTSRLDGSPETGCGVSLSHQSCDKASHLAGGNLRDHSTNKDCRCCYGFSSCSRSMFDIASAIGGDGLSNEIKADFKPNPVGSCNELKFYYDARQDVHSQQTSIGRLGASSGEVKLGLRADLSACRVVSCQNLPCGFQSSLELPLSFNASNAWVHPVKMLSKDKISCFHGDAMMGSGDDNDAAEDKLDNLGLTFGKRTGKILVKLKQTLFANFKNSNSSPIQLSPASSSNFDLGTANVSCSSIKNHNVNNISLVRLKEKHREESYDGNNLPAHNQEASLKMNSILKNIQVEKSTCCDKSKDFRASNRQPIDNSEKLHRIKSLTAYSSLASANSRAPIYDTPEFDATTATGSLSAYPGSKSVTRRAHSATRPNIPPPPPPPLPASRPREPANSPADRSGHKSLLKPRSLGSKIDWNDGDQGETATVLRTDLKQTLEKNTPSPTKSGEFGSNLCGCATVAPEQQRQQQHQHERTFSSSMKKFACPSVANSYTLQRVVRSQQSDGTNRGKQEHRDILSNQNTCQTLKTNTKQTTKPTILDGHDDGKILDSTVINLDVSADGDAVAAIVEVAVTTIQTTASCSSSGGSVWLDDNCNKTDINHLSSRTRPCADQTNTLADLGDKSRIGNLRRETKLKQRNSANKEANEQGQSDNEGLEQRCQVQISELGAQKPNQTNEAKVSKDLTTQATLAAESNRVKAAKSKQAKGRNFVKWATEETEHSEKRAPKTGASTRINKSEDTCNSIFVAQNKQQNLSSQQNVTEPTMGASHSSARPADDRNDYLDSRLDGLDQDYVKIGNNENLYPNHGYKNSNLVSSGKAMRKSTSNFIRNGSLKIKSTIKLPCRTTTSPKTIVNKMIGSIHHNTYLKPRGRKASYPNNSDYPGNRAAVTFAKVENPPDLKTQQQLHEQRRRSLKNGDVFIYPPIVRKLNECHKCSRDNKICDCNSVITEKSNEDSTDNIYENGHNRSEGWLTGNSLHPGVVKATLEKEVSSSKQNQKLTINPTRSAQICFMAATKPGISQRSGDRRNLPAPPVPPRTNNLGTFKQQRSGSSSKEQQSSGKTNGERQATVNVAQYGVDKSVHMHPTISPLSYVSGYSGAEDPVALQVGASSHGQMFISSTFSNEHLLPNPTTSVTDQIRVRDSGVGSESSCSSRSDSIRGSSEAGNISETNSVSKQITGTTNDLKTIRDVHYEILDGNDDEIIKIGGLNGQNNVGTRSTQQLNQHQIEEGSTQNNQVDGNESTLINRKSSGLDQSTETIIAIDYNNNDLSQEIGSPEKLGITNNMVIAQRRTISSCNLNVDNDISVSAGVTPFCMSGNDSTNEIIESLEPVTLDKNNTSVISIQNVSSRRRNLVSKLSRQAIHEDLDEEKLAVAAVATTIDMVSTPVSKLVVLPDSKMPGDMETKKIDLVCGEDLRGCNDALEYSPILSSVRDYIENVNTEIQFKTSPTPENLHEVPITLSTSSLVDSQASRNIACGSLDGHGAGGSSNTIALTPKSSSSVDAVQAITALTDSVNPITKATTTTILTTSQSSIMMPRNETFDSPKRSIFDGASKDEILEYLEDARERVPEVLIAADDVMVINENELIVVNQLDPNSPATPISIVETSRIVESEKCPSSLMSNSITSAAETSNKLEISPVDQNNDNGMLDDWHQKRLDSNCDSFDIITSNQDTSINRSLSSSTNNGEPHNHLKGYSFNTETTVDSIDDQALVVDIMNELVNCNDNQLISLHDDQQQQHQRIQLQQSEQQQTLYHRQLIGQLHRSGLKKQITRKDQSTCSSNTSNKSLSDTIDALGPIRLPFIIQRSTVYAGRRNSTSGGTSARDRDLDLNRVNRDSLSSSSSSPPSSTSPSSSNSSNQTSGECSATSNFYASSFLSSSSPFIAQNRASPISPAFGANSMTPVSNQMIISSRYYNYQRVHFSQTPPIDCAAAIPKDQPGDKELRALAAMGQECIANVIEQRDKLQSAIRLDLDELNSRDLETDELDSTGNEAGDSCIVLQAKENEPSTDRAATESRDLGVQRSSFISDDKQVEVVTESNKIDKKCPEIQESPEQSLNLNNANESPSSLAIVEAKQHPQIDCNLLGSSISAPRFTTPNGKTTAKSNSNNSNLMATRSSHGHHATISKLNNYLMSRQQPLNFGGELVIEFQCLDCDQFIYADQAVLMHKTNEMRQLRVGDVSLSMSLNDQSSLTSEQLDTAYIAAMNGLPLCKSCDKKRIERKEIISEFVETELKYGRDLKIIHDEFYRPMQIAGLLSKDQINGIFLNLDELIMAHCRFADRLGMAINEARNLGDQDYNTINIGKIFVESAEMLHTFESYCIRQGSAACLLARLAKEKELLRIFLRVSQMENTLLRRMNLAAFLMVPVQRVTKYPLLLNRLYKVTAYHHKDREALRDAQLKVELHLQHINQQTKGVGASNKIWRRISNLSTPISAHRRGLINTEDIGYMKLRKTAMEMLKWNRDETQFIHSGKLNFAPLNEHLTKQKMKPIRYIASHALLIVLGKPNWKYRPDLVKSTLDNKLMIPTPEGNGIREAALLLFREKNNRYVPCREPLFLSNCVLSNDCSQYNSECPNSAQQAASATSISSALSSLNKTTNQSISANGFVGNNGGSSLSQYANLPPNGATRRSISGSGDSHGSICNSATSIAALAATSDYRPASAEIANNPTFHQSVTNVGASKSLINHLRGSSTLLVSANHVGETNHSHNGSCNGSKPAHDTVSMSSLNSLPENQVGSMTSTFVPPPIQAPRSFSLASALPRAPITTSGQSAAHLNKSGSSNSSNSTILNHLMTKVNSYHHKQSANSLVGKSAAALAVTKLSANDANSAIGSRNRVASPNSLDSGNDSIASNKQRSISQRDGSLDSNSTTTTTTVANNNNNNKSRTSSLSQVTSTTTSGSLGPLIEVQQQQQQQQHQYYSHHYFHNHHQPYGDYEESFEIHERLNKESMLLRADTPLKTRYWLQMLRYHAKDLGQWRSRRNALSNIMVMRQEKWTDISSTMPICMTANSSSSTDCGLKRDGCQSQD